MGQLPTLTIAMGLLCGCGPAVMQETPQLPRMWKTDSKQRYAVLITGRDFNWHICYPGPDTKLGTEDDIRTRRHLHLPATTKVRLQLASDDYIYTMTLPDWSVREIAVPDLSFSLEFETQGIGSFDLLGYPLNRKRQQIALQSGWIVRARAFQGHR